MSDNILNIFYRSMMTFLMLMYVFIKLDDSSVMISNILIHITFH